MGCHHVTSYPEEERDGIRSLGNNLFLMERLQFSVMINYLFLGKKKGAVGMGAHKPLTDLCLTSRIFAES